MLKSNFDLMGGILAACCIAVYNFRKFVLVPTSHKLPFIANHFQAFNFSAPLGLKHLISEFFRFFYITSIQTISGNQKPHILSRFISNFKFVQPFYTPCIADSCSKQIIMLNLAFINTAISCSFFAGCIKLVITF